MRHTFLVVTVKRWLKSVTEVIAKLKPEFAFLDHPVMLATSAISKVRANYLPTYLFWAKQLLFPHAFCEVQKAPKSTAVGRGASYPLPKREASCPPPQELHPPPRPFGPHSSVPQFSTQIDTTGLYTGVDIDFL